MEAMSLARVPAARVVRLFAGLHQGTLGAEGWSRAGVAACAGLLSNLAFAPFFLWPLLFLTFPVLVWLIDSAGEGRDGLKRAFASGWWFGFGFFFAGLFWIGEAFLVEADKFGWALPFAVTLMPAGLALFFGAAAASARSLWSQGFRGSSFSRLFFRLPNICAALCLQAFPGIRLGMR